MCALTASGSGTSRTLRAFGRSNIFLLPSSLTWLRMCTLAALDVDVAGAEPDDLALPESETGAEPDLELMSRRQSCRAVRTRSRA